MTAPRETRSDAAAPEKPLQSRCRPHMTGGKGWPGAGLARSDGARPKARHRNHYSAACSTGVGASSAALSVFSLTFAAA